MIVYRPSFLRDALHNLSKDSGASDDYCKGLVVGMISVIMAVTDNPHKDAMQVLTPHLPTTEDYRKMPEDWWR